MFSIAMLQPATCSKLLVFKRALLVHAVLEDYGLNFLSKLGKTRGDVCCA